MKTINTKTALLISLFTFNAIFLASCSETTATVATETEKEFAIPVSVASIERNNISSNFHTTATLESRTEADIITRVTGIIEQLSVEEGDYVYKGQVLAEIDPRRYQLALDKADAELAGINQELQRLSLMAKKKLVSAQASDKLKFQHQAAVAARKLAALDLQDSQVVAPISGFISHRYVKAGYFTQGYQKLFHIVDATNLQAVVYLPEHQLSNVKLDQQANLSFSARQNQIYQAKVRSISPVIDPNSGTFKVILSIDNNEQELKPGMFAQIALTFATHHNTLTIPSDAIITLDNNSKIYLVRDNKAVEVQVNKGFIEEQLTEITGDIKAGDLVVVNGQHNLKADARVEVLNGDPSTKADSALKTNETAIVKAH
ncbi:efflux RND transporter periplasmic adaptor subunit [Colwellia sp. KU-HH00111]|uniref:efflux RND transporter periplasmic adaptor subunit n=1 Tax=Colwellia sp. KU-HH00111 TaxID=3127652 RepID=UPI003365835D